MSNSSPAYYRIGSHRVKCVNKSNSPRDNDHWECDRCGAYFRTSNGRTPEQELLATGTLYINLEGGVAGHNSPAYYGGGNGDLFYKCEIVLVGRIHNS